MTTFKIGNKVFSKSCPTLKGEITDILLGNEDEPELAVVNIWIPKDEPGFWYTGIYEEMWYSFEDLELQP